MVYQTVPANSTAKSETEIVKKTFWVPHRLGGHIAQGFKGALYHNMCSVLDAFIFLLTIAVDNFQIADLKLKRQGSLLLKICSKTNLTVQILLPMDIYLSTQCLQ